MPVPIFRLTLSRFTGNPAAVVEVPLCGHATLASAWVVLERLRQERQSVAFLTRSGPPRVRRHGPACSLDFSSKPATRIGCVPYLEGQVEV